MALQSSSSDESKKKTWIQPNLISFCSPGKESPNIKRKIKRKYTKKSPVKDTTPQSNVFKNWFETSSAIKEKGKSLFDFNKSNSNNNQPIRIKNEKIYNNNLSTLFQPDFVVDKDKKQSIDSKLISEKKYSNSDIISDSEVDWTPKKCLNITKDKSFKMNVEDADDNEIPSSQESYYSRTKRKQLETGNVIKPSTSCETKKLEGRAKCKWISKTILFGESSDSDDAPLISIKNRNTGKIKLDLEDSKVKKDSKKRNKVVKPRKEKNQADSSLELPKKSPIKRKKRLKALDIKKTNNQKIDVMFKSPNKPKKTVSKNNENKAKKRDSNSFEKYGCNLPSFDDILKDRAYLNNYKAKIDTACKFKECSPITKLLTFEAPEDVEVLGCEDISLEKIAQYFKIYTQYCLDIINEHIYSSRHETFMSADSSETNCNGLTYNTSMIVFSNQQKQLLAKLASKHFTACNIKNRDQYFFQVLLPELCLKIFMDVHDMDSEEALKYLDDRPVEDFL